MNVPHSGRVSYIPESNRLFLFIRAYGKKGKIGTHAVLFIWKHSTTLSQNNSNIILNSDKNSFVAEGRSNIVFAQQIELCHDVGQILSDEASKVVRQPDHIYIYSWGLSDLKWLMYMKCIATSIARAERIDCNLWFI